MNNGCVNTERSAIPLTSRALPPTLSTHAARVKAGFRRRRISILLGTPADTAKALRRNLEPTQIKELVQLLTDED
ncbi:hypothetical protein AB0454_43515 [Streptomyces sp. NPDC093509]|uniref:hypothetical protein n=1 Tax=Streptomyces sp. NPDC093509 TaxID=3154982 RepID=UPI00344CFD59